MVYWILPGTIRLKPNPNPENAVENLGFLRNYASSDQIERLNRWAIKSRDSIARWNRTCTMFYFDNTLIIRHIVLIALLLAMGPALHNPESIVENLGFSTQLRFKRSSATLQPYESLEAYELRQVAGSTSRSISTSRFPDRGGFPGGSTGICSGSTETCS